MKTAAPVQSKYMLLDITSAETTSLLLIGSMRQVQLHGQLLKATGRNVIAPPLEGRSFAKFDLLPLQYLFWNTFKTPPPSEYGEIAPLLRDHFEALPMDATPLDWLENEASKLAPPPPTENEGTTSDKPAPKEKRQHVPGTAYEQPKATTTTGLVWVLAAEVLAIMPALTLTTDWKPIRVAILAVCEKEGINAATAATQYSKFKASKIAALQS